MTNFRFSKIRMLIKLNYDEYLCVIQVGMIEFLPDEIDMYQNKKIIIIKDLNFSSVQLNLIHSILLFLFLAN